MKTLPINNTDDIEAIIKSCTSCVVSTVNIDGSPYSFPMNFAYEPGRIILHSGPTGSHIANLERDNRVSVVFTTTGELVFQHKEVACSYRMRSESVICKGRVHFISSDEDKIQELNKFMKHYTDNEFHYSAPAIRNVKVWIVEVEEMTARSFAVPHKR